MKINSFNVENFMIFRNLGLDISRNINLICGENNTGKTAILKLLYSVMKSYAKLADASRLSSKKTLFEEVLIEKLVGVYRPDDMAIGRLVSRKQGTNSAKVHVTTGEDTLDFTFSNKQKNHCKTIKHGSPVLERFNPIYIPPKEIISSTSNFASLYDDFHIDFEETYYDLAKLLARPLKRGANTTDQNAILSSFSEILNGEVIQKDNCFYLRMKGGGELEMGLVSEGYRKLSTLMYLISTGSITKDTVLFWDEPETNMNPKMTEPLIRAIIELANMGVQIFITTHDYFIQQCFNMYANYPEKNTQNVDIKFISLYRKNNKILAETAQTIQDLEHNPVMSEFDALYQREQAIIYGDLCTHEIYIDML